MTVVGFCTDSCSTGIAAGKILMTPTRELIANHKVTYLGLPDEDYKYFSVYLRPKISKYIPPPLDWYGDISHHIRNFRKNLSNKNKTLVFYSESDKSEVGTVEAGMWASMRYLERLASERGDLSRQFSLQDMVKINKWFDQRNDAAQNLIKLDTIKMLRRDHPDGHDGHVLLQ